jgi:hypothetical protein
MKKTAASSKPPHTSVILVVKGAGFQKPDETLDVFLNGFWPALKSIDPRATLHQRQDILPSGYRSSPSDRGGRNHVTEIQSGDHRIWIKEAYWEADITASSSLTALQREWRMATYAFGRTIHEFWFGLNTKERKDSLSSFLASFTMMYWLVLVWPLWLSVTERFIPFESILTQIVLVAAISFTTALVVATPAALETRRLTKQDDVACLPAMSNWVLFFLAAAFLLNPVRYLLGIGALALLQLALLRARAVAWPYRQVSNSDTDTKDYFAEMKDGKKRFWKRNLPLMRLSQLFYRYLVVVSLPLAFIGLTVARLLKWTRVLGSMGEALEGVLNMVLGSVLGDVVTYAMDPAQAHRVRCAVETDLKFFHDHPEVSDLHVFAHSQGTAITFEVLFHHLPDVYRSKIKTYLTIGSVLSYYHQANPILDSVYIRRFPVRPYPNFNPDFKWMNFWNLVDPITEFYGLDEYNVIVGAPPLDPEVKRHPSSPTNIKTRATPENHSEYWGNIDLVQRPFVRRVLGDMRPIEWAPDSLRLAPFGLSHQTFVMFLWAAWSMIFMGIASGLYWVWQQNWLDGFREFIRGAWFALEGEFAKAFPEASALIQRALGWFSTPSALRVYDIAVLVVLGAVLALIVINLFLSAVAEIRKRAKRPIREKV